MCSMVVAITQFSEVFFYLFNPCQYIYFLYGVIMLNYLKKKTFYFPCAGKDEVKSEEETTSKSISTTLDEDIKDEEEQEDNSKWDVLRNDFMMSAKLKDWDKKIEV